jgi:hypothetical protein
MEIIVHRVNKIKDLIKIPQKFGVEIDIRDFGKDLVIEHDPFKKGQSFEKYLKKYRHGTLILNVKSERIEYRIIDLLKKYKIKNYFFLDSSYPLMIDMTKKNIKDIAIRISDFESFENVKKFKNKCKWVWLEIFDNFEISKKEIDYLKKNFIKVCLVSPELHNRPKDINKIKKFLENKKINLSAVCTKFNYIKFWSK